MAEIELSVLNAAIVLPFESIVSKKFNDDPFVFQNRTGF